MRNLLLALILAVPFGLPSGAAESPATITIPFSEYEKLKSAVEAKEQDQYWKMTFQQILEKKNGDTKKAWELYEYYVLRRLTLAGTVAANVDKIISDIQILNEIDRTKPITINVTSFGGYVYNGLLLYNAMMTSAAPVNTVCNGVAASMAAVIVVAGDTRYATPSCHFMIHEVGLNGTPGGKTSDVLEYTEFVIDLEEMLLEIIHRHSGLSMDDVRSLSRYEVFYDGAEAARLGFIDTLLGAWDPALERGIPDDLLPQNRIKDNLLKKMGQ